MAFYAVKKGYKPGVYESWNECKKNVDGFHGAVYKKFNSEKEAQDFIANGQTKGKKFYAVQKGKTPGVYNSWEECKQNVEGVAGAKYRSFYSYDEAEEYANKKMNVENNPNEGVVAFVDGSYDDKTKTYAFGVVILDRDREIHFSGSGSDEEMAAMRNVAGEISGAIEAIKYAKDNGIKDITIVHDYAGISEWAIGNWKRNKKYTAHYYDFCQMMKNDVNFKFYKVKGHSNNFYNDVVDALAKHELGITNGIKSGIMEHIKLVKEKMSRDME